MSLSVCKYKLLKSTEEKDQRSTKKKNLYFDIISLVRLVAISLQTNAALETDQFFLYLLHQSGLGCRDLSHSPPSPENPVPWHAWPWLVSSFPDEWFSVLV